MAISVDPARFDAMSADMKRALWRPAAPMPAAGEPVRQAAQGAAALKPLPAIERAADALQPRDGLAPRRDAGETVLLVRGDTVKLEPVRWLWPGYLPHGMLSIIGGAPGAGKSTIALSLAATVTSGGRWPCGARCEPGDVLIWSGEDQRSLLCARLQAAGADMARVHFVDRLSSGEAFDPGRDMAALEARATALRAPRLLILDPVVSAVAGDSHKNSETRRALQPVVDLAERLGCAVFGVTHLSKGTTGREPVERVTGSLAFAALARVVLVVARQRPEPGSTDEPRRLLLRAKSNIGPDTGGFEYTLDRVTLAQDVEAQRVLWGARVDGTARDLLHEAEAEAAGDPEERTERQEAADWLRDLLAGGPMRVKDIMSQARDYGHSERTLQRARRQIGATVERDGFGGGCRWRLSILAIPAHTLHSRHTLEPGKYAENGADVASMDAADGPGEVF